MVVVAAAFLYRPATDLYARHRAAADARHEVENYADVLAADGKVTEQEARDYLPFFAVHAYRDVTGGAEVTVSARGVSQGIGPRVDGRYCFLVRFSGLGGRQAETDLERRDGACEGPWLP
ncbi:hypothetical protein EDD29_6667 [Actinocorallia herbida]|uniref:Uncharacterized protein n=1 Tax=Actinocorallia herbida TaxID=58109 RepID=A0A3N1D642_9ACTN|nr:hypothetical protein [Actinocorallia herbida]ROO88980.1 hypothetical protein EDD29_6667 [Actinocorallia herbida]